MLRQEIYALRRHRARTDDRHPYTVTEQNFTIRAAAAAGGQPPRRLLHPRPRGWTSATTTSATRADPRVQHALTLEVDAYGNVLQARPPSATARRHADSPSLLLADRGPSRQHDAAHLHRKPRHQRRSNRTDAYRTPLPCETRTFELTGYHATGAGRSGIQHRTFRSSQMPANAGRLAPCRRSTTWPMKSLATKAQRAVDPRPPARSSGCARSTAATI